MGLKIERERVSRGLEWIQISSLNSNRFSLSLSLSKLGSVGLLGLQSVFYSLSTPHYTVRVYSSTGCSKAKAILLSLYTTLHRVLNSLSLRTGFWGRGVGPADQKVTCSSVCRFWGCRDVAVCCRFNIILLL